MPDNCPGQRIDCLWPIGYKGIWACVQGVSTGRDKHDERDQKARKREKSQREATQERAEAAQEAGQVTEISLACAITAMPLCSAR